MARLSAENHNSNAATPKSDRKSGRLRDIFKSRASSISSPSPVTSVKPLPVPSSVSSPTVKAGFQKIGLLPSERSSFETVRQRVVYDDSSGVDAGSKQSLEGVSDSGLNEVSQPMPNSPGPSLVGTAALGGEAGERSCKRLSNGMISSADRSHHQGRFSDGQVNLRSSDVAFSTLSGPSNEFSTLLNHDKSSSNLDGESTVLQSRYAQAATGLAGTNMIAGANIGDIVPKKTMEQSGSGVGSTVGLTQREYSTLHKAPVSIDLDRAIGDQDSTGINKKVDELDSLATRLRTYDGSICQDIRNYIRISIAEAMVKHEKKTMDQEVSRMRASPHFDRTGYPFETRKSSMSHRSGDAVRNTDILSSFPRTIGPIPIARCHGGKEIQIAVILIYVAVLLVSAYHGPANLALTLSKLAVVLTIYTTMVSYYSWWDGLSRDILLAPVILAAWQLQTYHTMMANEIAVYVKGVLVEALIQVIKEIEDKENADG